MRPHIGDVLIVTKNIFHYRHQSEYKATRGIVFGDADPQRLIGSIREPLEENQLDKRIAAEPRRGLDGGVG
jgi:hypothetical protein